MLRLSLHRIESRLGAFKSLPPPSAILSKRINGNRNPSVRTLAGTRRDQIISPGLTQGARAPILFYGVGDIQRAQEIPCNHYHSWSSTTRHHRTIAEINNNNNIITKQNNIMTISSGRPEQQRRQAGTSAGNYAPTHAVPFNDRSSMDHQYCDPNQELPSLPVPSLKQTMDRLKLSVAPFAMNSLELAETLELIDQFQASAGQKLDLLLKQKAGQVKNWMAHDWWMTESYLKCREPLMINSNPAMIYPRFPKMIGKMATVNELISRLVSAFVDCREAIRQGANLESMSRRKNQQAICLDQYNKVFGTTRIPELESDLIHIKDISSPLDTFKIIITYKNRFYELDLTDKEYKDSNRTEIQQQRRLDTIRNALEIIVNNQVENNNAEHKTTNHKDYDNGVGILTSLPRDHWARVYRLLDEDALRAIDEAQFVLCLDTIKDQYQVERFLDETTNLRAIGKQILHADPENIGNRWFDKTLQLVVVIDDKMENLLGAGINYEHTVSEAAVISRIIEYTFNKVVSMPESLGHTTVARSLNLNTGSTIKELFQNANFSTELSEAKQHYNTVTNLLDLEVLNFAHYGKRAIKTWQFSPDSWIQVALSFAHYNLHGRLAPCYESASVRKFACGRTETIRSLTQEVGEFCMNPTYESLKQAIKSHKKLALEASNGEGVDRVLMGYRLAFNEIRSDQWKWGLTFGSEHGDDTSVNRPLSLHDIFSDKDISIISSFMNNELIQRSKRFVLSTSQVNSPFPNTFMTYGPLVPEGYGCCYNPTDNQIVVAITANSCNPSLVCSTSKYKTALEEGLLKMSDLVQQNYISKSKL